MLMTKFNTLVLALSVCVAAGAAVVPQGDKPAEQVFKNIVVLKGSPARDVLPSMNFICASLKVECSYCHVNGNFPSDDKEEKHTARRMIEMERKLNEEFFKGRTVVTCISCHNGKTSPTRMALPTGLNRRHEKVEGVTAEAVLKKYFEASGKDLSSLVLKGTLQSGDEKATPVELTQKGSNKYFASYEGRQFGYDGVDNWTLNGKRANKNWGDSALRIQRMWRSFRGQHAFDSFGTLEVAGRDKVNGKGAVILRASVAANQNTEEFYFDETSGLLARVATITDTPLGRFAEFYDYSNYKNIAGTKVAERVAYANAAGDTWVMKFRPARANVDVDDKMFAFPVVVAKPGG